MEKAHSSDYDDDNGDDGLSNDMELIQFCKINDTENRRNLYFWPPRSIRVHEPTQSRLIKCTTLLFAIRRAQMASRRQMWKQRIGRVRPNHDRHCLHSSPLLLSLDMFDQLPDIIPLSLFHSTLLGLLT